MQSKTEKSYNPPANSLLLALFSLTTESVTLTYMLNLILNHCVKSVRIWGFPYSDTFQVVNTVIVLHEFFQVVNTVIVLHEFL